MTLMAPFTPGPTVNVASGAGVSSAATPLGKVGQQALVTSESGGTQAKAFIKFGDAAMTAADATNTPILPGTAQVFTPPAAATHFAVFSAAVTLVYVTSGFGE